MKKTSIILLAALLPLVACQNSKAEAQTGSTEQATTKVQSTESMAMASFELGKVP